MRAITLAILLPLAACGNFSGDFGGGDDKTPGVAGTGSGNARSYAVADFTRVALRGPDDVDVRVGSGFSVRAEGDAKVLEKLKIEKVGETLKVGRVRGFSWGSDKGAKIYVTMPRIMAAALAGSGDLTVDRAESARFTADLAGSGDLTVSTIAAQSADLSIAGSGGLHAGGTADALKVDIAGSGDVDASGLTATRANVSIAGSGSVTAIVNGPAKVSIMGSGDVDLGPKARCETSKMGSGTVRCGG